ncbi:MAG: AMP-binding protein [Flavobacteriales bacterium]|nr:AMP-binding protein [Flavobacteriales bacterium]
MSIPEIETKSFVEVKQHQELKLQELLSYVIKNSKYYQRVFKAQNIDISQIKLLEDLAKLPTTSKDDLQKHNDDFICVNSSEIIDYITTSGTLGDPVVFAMTNNDLDRLAYNEEVSFACANTTKDDIYQLMVTLDRRFMAGMAYFSGLRKLGAGVIRVGPGNPELQFDTIERIKPTALVTVPSFLVKLIEYAEKNGIDYKNSSIKKAVCIGESLRNADFSPNTLAQKIQDKWNIELYSTYASTEMGTAFTECKEGKGGHHHPELVIVEFLDDEGNQVGKGEAGEVTITTLGVEAMPLIRFRTGDICHHYTEKCACGRTSMRLGPIVGRKRQMIKYKGTTIYPPALYNLLNEIEDVENYIVEVSTNNIGTDDILIRVGSNNTSDKFEKTIKDHFRAKLRVAPTIRFENPKQILKEQFPEMSRKPITFVDKR